MKAVAIVTLAIGTFLAWRRALEGLHGRQRTRAVAWMLTGSAVLLLVSVAVT